MSAQGDVITKYSWLVFVYANHIFWSDRFRLIVYNQLLPWRRLVILIIDCSVVHAGSVIVLCVVCRGHLWDIGAPFFQGNVLE
jgi:hypothetical protein